MSGSATLGRSALPSKRWRTNHMDPDDDDSARAEGDKPLNFLRETLVLGYR
jgi:hypothetical protein